MSLQSGLIEPHAQQQEGCYVPRRHVFTFMGFCAVTICMIGQTVSLVIVPMSREMGWSDQTKGLVMSGYFYGYAPCCAVGGALALRLNRPVAQILLLPLLTMAILSALLPTVVVRLKHVECFGMESCSEVGAFVTLVLMGNVQATLNPALHRMISVWSPLAERSAQHNFIYSGQQAGQVIGLATGGLIIDRWGWSGVFYCNAIVIAVFASLWLLSTADNPRKHGGCSETERLLIEADAGPPHSKHGLCSMPWRQILATPAVLVLFVNHCPQPRPCFYLAPAFAQTVDVFCAHGQGSWAGPAAR